MIVDGFRYADCKGYGPVRRIDAKNLPFVELGNSDDLMIGEWVIAFGNPFGFLLEDTRPTVTVGVVSALDRSIKSTSDERYYKIYVISVIVFFNN